MHYESHEQFAFESYKGFEIADAFTANGENKIWIGLGDSSGHASGVWLTAHEARNLARLIYQMAEAHDNRLHSTAVPHRSRAAGGAVSQDPTAFPG